RSPADAAGGAPRLREPFAAFVLDDASRQAAIKAANEQGWTGARVAEGGIAGAIDTLGDAVTPCVLLIDLSESPDPVGDINRLAEVCQEGTRVVALGRVNDIELFRRLMETGVDDYLVKPVTAAQLNTAFARLSRERVATTEALAPGQLVVLIGTRGGIGSTALAVNLAWLAAHDVRKRTALVDLDLQFGSTALALDIEPSRGMAEALQNPGRIDDLLVERSSVKVDEQLCVLCAEEGLERPVRMDPTAIDALIDRLRASYECVVVDLPRAMTAGQAALVGAADAVVVVTDYTLIGARDCPRLLKRIRELSPKGKVIVVANRVGAPGHSDLKRADLEKTIDAKVDCEIPQDQKGASESVQTGKPMVVSAPRSKAADAMRALARQICGDADAAKPSLWRRLTGKAN
ncbi:MAG: AAA family ATPase, partial [Alphaproteobacteria bacterium]|nr:AAA family ATPase [Alphaproteobacteria bacterium]